MTTLIERGQTFCRCDVCGADSPEIESDDIVAAQRVALTFFSWRVFKLNGVWQHSCPQCVVKWRKS
jgi:hypothetical protein